MILADKTNMDSNFVNFIQKLTVFVLFYKLKNTFLTSVHLSFLFTNKQCYRLLRLANHRSTFHPVLSTKLNMFNRVLVSGTRKIWHADQFLVSVDWYQKRATETGQCVITITVHSFFTFRTEVHAGTYTSSSSQKHHHHWKLSLAWKARTWCIHW